MKKYSVIAISDEDKILMLELLSRYENKTGKRQSFAKFLRVLMDAYKKHEEGI